MEISLDKVKKDISEKNYSELPFTLDQDILEKSATAFLEFLSLPKEYKERFGKRISLPNQIIDQGYHNRARKKGQDDDKEYFHYNKHFLNEYRDTLKKASPEFKNFLAYAGLVYEHVEKLLEKLTMVLEEEYAGIYKKFFYESNHPNNFLRFLKYENHSKESILAKAHYDRGTLTFAIAESAPGLRVGSDKKSLRLVSHKNKEVLFMPAFTLSQITSSDFAPAWHDVVENIHTKKNVRSNIRWAIVFFSDANGTPLPSGTDVHTAKIH